MARDDNPLDGFGLFGIVKETGVDDEGLVEFHSYFFPYQLYRDEESAFYASMGSRKLGLSSWNPIRLYRGFRNMSKRLAGKKISGNLVGEGLVQGGILVFDAGGNARYAYLENTGSEVPIDDLLAAVRAVRDSSSTDE